MDYAASNVAAGDTVYVGAGTYFDEINMTSGASGTAADPIRFIADTDGSQTGDTGNVTLDGITGETIWVEDIDHIHFVRFRITNGSDAGVLWRNSTGGLLQNCYIYDTAMMG